MATLFTKIIDGDLPGRFVWEDEHCVGFLTIEPLTPGHTLVVPRQEVDHWLDLEADLRDHLMAVSQAIGQAIQHVWQPERVGLAIVGLEVNHVHLHLAGIRSIADMDWSQVDRSPSAESLDDARDQIRAALRELGAAGVSERG